MKKNITQLELENLQLRERVEFLERMLKKNEIDDSIKYHPTFEIVIEDDSQEKFVDENAIKAVLNEACRFIANEILSMNCLMVDEIEQTPKAVAVRIEKLKSDGKTVNLKSFGTNDVMWQPHYQTEYQP